MEKYNKICICVGHYKKKQGVRSARLGISEWQINSILAAEIERESFGDPYLISIIYDLNLIRKIRRINEGSFDICIDLHCNSAPIVTTGHEVLYYWTSRESEILAHFISRSITINQERRIKEIQDGVGSFFLSKTRPLAVIIESCFANSESDFQAMSGNIKKLAGEIVGGIRDFNSYYMIKPQIRK